ncbi:hypothetical protein AHAS_Ahas16G0185100 [Arachis hypogaea]
MLRRGVIGIWLSLLVTTRGSTISIVLVCTLEWLLLIINWRRLLPRGLIKSLWLLLSLIVPTSMHVLIIVSSSCNIVVTKLIAKGVRVHSS